MKYLYYDRLPLVTQYIESDTEDLAAKHKQLCLQYHSDKNRGQRDERLEPVRLAFKFVWDNAVTGENWDEYLRVIYEYKIGNLSEEDCITSMIRFVAAVL